MGDIVDAATRSRMMSGIRGKNTKPEMLVRLGLHRKGFRYRLHVADLPGKPDMVFPKRRAVIMVNGCFWHGHDCPLFRWPSTREDFWKKKITRNQEKDAESRAALEEQGWRVLTIWECALRGRTKQPMESIIDIAAEWLNNGTGNLELRGG